MLVPRVGTSFVQCFAWSAKRGQMCLVCPTPCAVRLGITGAEHTRPCWCLFRTGQMCLVCPTLCAVRLGITGAEHTRPCWCIFRTGPMCLVCPTLCEFAWVSRALNILARVGALCWYLFRAVLGSACTVLSLVRTGHVPTCPCSHLYRYLLCRWTARALYFLVRVLNVPTCPCSCVHTCPRLYPCTVFCYG